MWASCNPVLVNLLNSWPAAKRMVNPEVCLVRNVCFYATVLPYVMGDLCHLFVIRAWKNWLCLRLEHIFLWYFA